MRFITKAGILACILAIPALVLFTLHRTGKNYYDLPVFYPKDSALVNGRYVITSAHTIPPFYFTSQNNTLFSSEELQNKIYVANFFFTTCPDICPKMTSQLTRVQEAFSDNPEVKIVSFTVNPKRNSVEVLKQYALQYNADSSRWKFLTGGKDSLYTLAQKGFFVSAMEDEKLPEFIHSEKLILVDKQGRIRGYYNGTDKEAVDRLIREIQVLIYAYDNQPNSKE